MAGELVLRTTLADSKTTTVLADKRLKILNDGAELLNVKVPNGKIWVVTITVYVEETEA